MRCKSIFLSIILFISLLNAQTRPQGDGLTGDYYRGYTFDSLNFILDTTGLDLAFSRVDGNFDIWNGVATYSWQPVVGWANNYSVHWNGYIFIDSAGHYGFGSISDDASQILIDGQMVVDNGESQWYDWEDNISEGSANDTLYYTPFLPLYLNRGFHKIAIKFAEWSAHDGIEVWWIKPSEIDSSDIPWYGENFHGVAPSFNPNTNWEILPKSVLYTKGKRPPVAGRDSLLMAEDSMITFNPYRNDNDPDTTYFSISGYDLPLHGTLSYISDSTFSYQPNADFFGGDSFYYYIQDDYTQTDTGVVVIHVSNIPDRPATFQLTTPVDSYTTDNDWNIEFAWSPSYDADNDTLIYYLKIFNDNSDTTITVGPDTSFNFDGSAFFSEGNTFHWTSWVEDTMFTVHADTFLLNISLLVSVNDPQEIVPLKFSLTQNYPNPFNPTTVISYGVGANHDSPVQVELSVYNILGKKVATLVSAKQQPGQYTLMFDASQLAGGVYFYRLQAGNFISHKKMILLK